MLDRLLNAPMRVRKMFLAGLGAVLLVLAVVASTSGGGNPDTDTDTAPAQVHGPAVTAPTPGAPSTPAATSAADPAASTALPLPMSQEDIDSVATEAVEFITAYTSYRFDQDDTAWLNTVSARLADNSQVDPRSGLPTGNLATLLADEQQVTTSTAHATGVLFLSESTVTYSVVADKTTTTVSGTTTSTATYEVALTRTDGSWGVSELRQVDGDGATTETD
jgi:hypothetical protein